jgi:hypothetical protein
MKSVEIKYLESELLTMTIVRVIFIVSSVIILFEEIKHRPFVGLIIVFGSAIALFYTIRETVIKKPIVTLYEHGIELRSSGWIHWDYIECYNTYGQSDDGSRIDYLAVKLKDQKVLRQNISKLDKNRGEIVQLIKLYRPELPYLGHLLD